MNLLRNSKIVVVSCTIATGVGVGLASSSAAARTANRRASSISSSSFTTNFSALKALRPLAKAGTGKIAAIFPDTTSSTRYVEFDAPYVHAAAAAAGLPASDVITQNGQGSDTKFMADVKADIANGVTVLMLDPEDQGTGVEAQIYAKQHGVKVIQYDRLSPGKGAIDTDPYVSFNNVVVGELIGKGFVACTRSWLHGQKAKFIEMHGSPTDNNATLFTEGYNKILNPLVKSGKIIRVANTAGTWNPTSPSPDALDEFKAALQAHPNANSAVIPNDENGAPIITYLRSQGVKPHTFPTTGQDATLTGLDNILSGYQCGTVYKPIYKEAEAAVALALFMRAGQKPPKALVNGHVTDPITKKSVPSVLLTPEWVTASTIKKTVLADKFVPAKQLCASPYTADCAKYGIKP
ncbi:MAG: substrate-binding domain-containing protein [Solirubrobacteraceae bacterium]